MLLIVGWIALGLASTRAPQEPGAQANRWLASLSSLGLAEPTTRDAEAAPPGMGGLFSSTDYPPAALAAHEEGAVSVLIKVDRSGAVADCVIENSSGFADLDARTCEIIRSRARFTPAKDAAGNSVESELHQKIAWRIAQPVTPSTPWLTRTTMDYGPDGSAVSCRIERAGSLVANGPAPQCPAQAYQRHVPTVPGFDVVTRTIAEQRFELGTGTPPEPEPGDVLVGRKVLALEVGADGKLKSCSPVLETGIGGPTDACSRVPQVYEPHHGSDGKPTSFAAAISLNLYIHQDPGN